MMIAIQPITQGSTGVFERFDRRKSDAREAEPEGGIPDTLGQLCRRPKNSAIPRLRGMNARVFGADLGGRSAHLKLRVMTGEIFIQWTKRTTLA